IPAGPAKARDGRRLRTSPYFLLSHTGRGDPRRLFVHNGLKEVLKGNCTYPRLVGENNLDGESRPLPEAWYGNARAAGDRPDSPAGLAGRDAARAAARSGAKARVAANGSIRGEAAAA